MSLVASNVWNVALVGFAREKVTPGRFDISTKSVNLLAPLRRAKVRDRCSQQWSPPLNDYDYEYEYE